MQILKGVCVVVLLVLAGCSKHDKPATYLELKKSIEDGNLIALKKLIGSVNVDLLNKRVEGYSLLGLVALEGTAEMAKILIDAGGDVDTFGDNDESSPLLIAVFNGNSDVARFLIGAKANINLADKDNFTPLMAASQCGYADLVKLLLDKGADTEVKMDTTKATAIFYAVIYRNPAVVEMLLNKKSNPNLVDGLGYTPLRIAVEHDSSRIVKILLDNGADPDFVIENIHTNEKQTVIIFANTIEIVELLLAAGADVNASGYWGGQSLLTRAISYNDDSKVAFAFIDAGVDINDGGPKGNPPILEALMRRKYDIADLLYKNGAEIDVRDLLGNNIIMRAVRLERFDWIKRGVEAGLDINAINNDGETALMNISSYGVNNIYNDIKCEDIKSIDDLYKVARTEFKLSAEQKEIIKYLFDHGADVTLLNNKNETIIDLAKKRENIPLTSSLLSFALLKPHV